MILSSGARHYLITALWSTIGFSEDENDFMLDEKFSVEDISEEFQAKAEQDMEKFLCLALDFFEEDELDSETIGDDFWLTRNGHGAGFWDGDYKHGRALTEIVKKHFPHNEDDLRESIIEE